MVVFFVKSNENTYPKGRALMQMYRVVPITKRWNWARQENWKTLYLFTVYRSCNNGQNYL